MAQLLTKLLLLSLITSLTSCSGNQFLDRPSLGSLEITPTPLPKSLEVDEEDFRIELGAEWKMEKEGESYIFNDVKGLRQITIAVLRPSGTPAGKEIEHLGRESIRMRQDALKKLSGGNITFSEISSTKVLGGYDIVFSATDELNGVKINSTTFARPKRVATVSFNKYSPFPSDEELNRQFAAILTGFKLKD